MINNRIIVSLDGISKRDATTIAYKVQDHVWGFKVNDLIIDHGTQIISVLKRFGNVMADIKLFDIPNTMNNGINAALCAGADIITVHCAANYRSKHAAKLAGITILTSVDNEQCLSIFGKSVDNAVGGFASFAAEAGYGYIVCSAHEATMLQIYPFKKICPGIRPLWYGKVDDQKRVMTPKMAIDAGADFLVVGRAITKSDDCLSAVKRINDEISSKGI